MSVLKVQYLKTNKINPSLCLVNPLILVRKQPIFLSLIFPIPHTQVKNWNFRVQYKIHHTYSFQKCLYKWVKSKKFKPSYTRTKINMIKRNDYLLLPPCFTLELWNITYKYLWWLHHLIKIGKILKLQLTVRERENGTL